MKSSPIERAFAPFFVLAVLELSGRALALPALTTLTKPLLMPALVLGVCLARQSLPRRALALLFGGLFFSWVGDVVLMFQGELAFAGGLGAFLLAHIFYIALLVLHAHERVAPLSAVYFVAAAGLVFTLAPHVGDLLVPIAVYAATLAAMAVLATRGGVMFARGAVLFIVSDAILALSRFVPDARIPAPAVLVMATYLAAQYCIARGALGLTSEAAEGNLSPR